MTRFAISVPVGAWHPLLPQTLDSLLAQDAPVEIALLDASGDRRVRELAERHAGALAHVRHGPDGGQSAAILEGWSHLPGDVLGWLNADDVLAPGALGRVAAALGAPEAPDLVTGHSTICDPAGRLIGYHWAVERPTEKILRECVMSQPSTFFLRQAHDAVGGLDPALHYTMDWDLWTRLWKAGKRFAFIDDVLSQVLWGETTKTGQFNRARRRELERLISGNHRLRDRVNARVGFAVHHFLEQPALRRFGKPVRQRMAPHLEPICGLGADGELHGQARLPLFHYRHQPARNLRLQLHSPAKAPVHLRVGNETTELRAGDCAACLRLESPIAAGQSRTAEMSAPAGADVRIAYVEMTA